MICSLLKMKLLKTENYDVRVASDGNKGFQIAKKVQPDLIILDIVMGSVGGPDVAARLSKYSSTQSIPIVFLSSLIKEGEGTVVEDFFEGNFFIPKASDVNKIIDTIEDYVQTHLMWPTIFLLF